MVVKSTDESESSVKTRSGGKDTSSADNFRDEYINESFDKRDQARSAGSETQAKENGAKATESNTKSADSVLPSLTISSDNSNEIASKKDDNKAASESPKEANSKAKSAQPDAKVVDNTEFANPEKRTDSNKGDEDAGLRNSSDPTHDSRTRATDNPAAADMNSPDKNMRDAQVGFWGDDHNSLETKDQFIKTLEQLKKDGVTTVAMELFTKDLQATIDQYFNPNSTPEEQAAARQKLREHLDKVWNPVPNTELDQANKTKAINDKIMEIVDAIKANGMTMLAVEPNGLVMTPQAQADPEQRKLSGARDNTWERTMREHLRNNPNAKIVLFQGGPHLDGGHNGLKNLRTRVLRESTGGSSQGG